MDNLQILLEKSRSTNSVNMDAFVSVDLTSKARLLPYNNVSDVLNLTNLYNQERDNCNKYRIILTVNPVCSNVLFNNRTEIVRYEGSDDCILINGNTTGETGEARNSTELDWKQGIRDTEYTHPLLFEDKVPYVYHCGLDMFNNHMLRSEDFTFINKTEEKNETFNTLWDYVRDNSGETVSEFLSLVSTGDTEDEKEDVHIYQYDNVMTFYDAFMARLNEKNGWYGFNNSTNITIPNAPSGITINKIMNNNKACEIIDMYPDRSLYSFIPKVNKYRHRLENNWDYCIAYPSEKDFDKITEICDVDNLLSGLTENNGGHSMRIEKAERAYTGSGNLLIRMKTMLKHTLNVGDYIRLYYSLDGELVKHNTRLIITSTGDYNQNNRHRYFSLRYNDLSNKFLFDDETGEVTDLEGNSVQFFFKKDINGTECQYYFRKFEKILNYNYNTELASEVNKLAYGENIYGDRVAQIIFTDDIDVTGLKDHNNKPLTELYFIPIKRNKGHELWYESGETASEEIEFSHCFGKLTSGLDLETTLTDYNVRKLHNINIDDIDDYADYKDGTKYLFGDFGDVKPIEDDIMLNVNSANTFYGDIVEFDPINCREKVIENVYFRFNTAQREVINENYFDILYDELTSDDYDYDITGSGFTITSGFVNTVKIDDEEKKFAGNLNPEGYFYKALNKLQIKEESNIISSVIGKYIKYDIDSVTKSSTTVIDEYDEEITLNTFTFDTIINNNLMKGDYIYLFDSDNKNGIWTQISGVSGNTVTLVSEDDFDFVENTSYVISTKEGVPTYATYVPMLQSFVWREIVPPSELSVDSALYDRPFANGCFYIHENINVFLRRQDPVGEYGLPNLLESYRIYGWDKIDFDTVKYINNDVNEICY